MTHTLIKEYAQRIKSIDWSDDLVRRNPLFYNRVKRTFEWLHHASLEDRKRWTASRVRYVVGKAAKTRYGKNHDADNLEDWPYLDKTAVRDDPHQFLGYPVFLTSPASTSGTTGTPLQLYRSALSVVVEQLCIDRIVELAGKRLDRIKIALLRGDQVKAPSDQEPPYWRYSLGRRKLVLSSNHLNAATVGRYVKELGEFRPDCLMAYPTSLDSLCRLMQERNRYVGIPLVVTSSEVLTEQTREAAGRLMGCKLVDYYGQAERVTFAYSLRPQEYFFLPGYAYTELIYVRTEGDRDLYEIVGTPLWNLAMPLIRYRTGDLIEVRKGTGSRELEEIRYGVRPFIGIAGRSNDYLLSPTGGRLVGIDHIPRGVRHVRQVQVIQERPDKVRLLVIPKEGFQWSDRSMLMKNAHEKLPPAMEISVEIVDELERTPQGKAPFVIRREGVENNWPR